MVDTCFYFQVHQPLRLRNYSVFDVGQNSNYYNDKKNKEIMERVARKCYLPANQVILELLNRHPEFKASYSFSGMVLEQFEEFAPQVLDSFQSLVDTGRIELLDETYYHSLSCVFSKKEFIEQVKKHNKKIRKLFGAKPKVFRNTELIYNNELAKTVEGLGYKAILAEGADHILGWRSPNFVYKPVGAKKIKLLLKNYRLSDDIAFRFSERSWKEWPLTAEKFAEWVNAINGNGFFANLFMDYETFGEHQWHETGIFEFMKKFPEEFLKNKDNGFAMPSELAEKHLPVAELDFHNFVSWADIERDLSAWTGNQMQSSALHKLFALEEEVKECNDEMVLEDWRKLQVSDNFYYMCTKWFNDGDVHKYFNPFDSPYDGFIAFMNILEDLKIRIKEKQTLKVLEVKKCKQKKFK